MNVAIIGAGYAGLAAAVTLAAASVPVAVYEAGHAPGGRARRVDINGMALDNGMHILLGAYRETLALMRTVGVDPREALLALPLDWDIEGAFRFAAAPLPAPLHLACGLLRTRGAPWKERWAAARFLAAMRRRQYRLASDTSVAALLAQQGQGPAFVRHLWEPLCLAALNTPLESASAQVFLNVLRDGLDATPGASRVLLARRDLSALLPEPCVEFILGHGGTVMLRTAVRALDYADGRFRVGTPRGEAEYTHVVCATSPHHTPALIAALPGMSRVAAEIEALRYEPIHTVYLQYDASVRLRKPMIGLHRGAAHWLFDRGAICAQPGLIAGVVSASTAHSKLVQHALANAVHQDVARVTGHAHAPAWWRVIGEKRATFACTAALQRPAHRTPLPGLLIAGDYTASEYPATLESAVRSGIACARAVLA